MPSPNKPKTPAEKLDEVDEASVESFPASDAPAWTHSHAGGPDHEPKAVQAAMEKAKAEAARNPEAGPEKPDE